MLYLCIMKHLHPLHTDLKKPERFTYPFAYEPHPLCRMAAAEVQAYIASHPEIREDADRGKMFGVLVVEESGGDGEAGASGRAGASGATGKAGGMGYLAAYSGLLAGRNDWAFFVPPVYDAQQPDGHFKTVEREISRLTKGTAGAAERAGAAGGAETTGATETTERAGTANDPKAMSQELQEWLFHQYQMLNARGERRDLVDLWQEYYSRPKLRRRYPLPPGGTGDCCAPKLLQYAYEQGLKPVCMAEFWWGATTKTELRQHLNFYPACRGKCKPILTWMLQGLDVDPDPESLGFEHMELPVVYEDDYLLVVNKPSGLLSTPGRIEQYSVETIMQQRYPGSFICHRLDFGTSGLLIVAKSLDVFRRMQEQFVRHEVRKKYLAILEKPDDLERPEIPDNPENPESPESPESPDNPLLRRGTISLPMRPDPMNRPRQVVDMEHGKRAVTDYEFLSELAPSGNRPGGTLVALWPHTGRTHQLRIHCAHPDGLARPIVGDPLYGTVRQLPDGSHDRLWLHAAEIWFCHPVSGEQLHFEAEASGVAEATGATGASGEAQWSQVAQ